LKTKYSNILIILLAFITSLLICEIFCEFIIKFPKYSVEKQLFGIQKSRYSQRIFKPNSDYLSRESGYKVYKRNNIGFTGNDININDSSYKNIFLLGSSFVEAIQVEPDSMASSVFNSYLRNNHSKYQVINCAAGGHDMYDSYFRFQYFGRIFGFSKIIYILDGVWMHENNNLDFNVGDNFGKINNSLFLRIHDILRNNSSLLNLFTEYLKEELVIGNVRNVELEVGPGKDNFNVLPNLEKCISQFGTKYSSDFILLSLDNNHSGLNDTLKSYCEKNNINFVSDTTIITDENILNGRGHLNKRGNDLLAKKIINVFEEFIGKKENE
jgi:hypothetical protein